MSCLRFSTDKIRFQTIPLVIPLPLFFFLATCDGKEGLVKLLLLKFWEELGRHEVNSFLQQSEQNEMKFKNGFQKYDYKKKLTKLCGNRGRRKTEQRSKFT